LWQASLYSSRLCLQRDLVPTCRELGIAFLAYSPMSRGLLTANFTIDENDFKRKAFPRFAEEAMQQVSNRHPFTHSSLMSFLHLSVCSTLYASDHVLSGMQPLACNGMQSGGKWHAVRLQVSQSVSQLVSCPSLKCRQLLSSYLCVCVHACTHARP